MVTVTEHLSLVPFLVRKMVSREHPLYDDLVQEGMIGLMRAADKYDPSRGVTFSSYAKYWIRAYVLLYLRRYNGTVYRKWSGYIYGVTDILVDTRRESAEETYARVEELGIFLPKLNHYIDTTTDREKYLLTNRLLTDEPESMQSIADRWDISKQRVDEIEKRLIVKLRKVVTNVN